MRPAASCARAQPSEMPPETTGVLMVPGMNVGVTSVHDEPSRRWTPSESPTRMTPVAWSTRIVGSPPPLSTTLASGSARAGPARTKVGRSRRAAAGAEGAAACRKPAVARTMRDRTRSLRVMDPARAESPISPPPRMGPTRSRPRENVQDRLAGCAPGRLSMRPVLRLALAALVLAPPLVAPAPRGGARRPRGHGARLHGHVAGPRAVLLHRGLPGPQRQRAGGPLE